MSIHIQHLSKYYGAQKALDEVSFEIGESEIVGFLGPNGAGKSTTMKIITGFIPPTEGLVHVAGFDVVANPGRVKKVTGYLPENNPLYLEMYVSEFLRFSGGLYGLKGSLLKQRMGEMIEKCGLASEQHKKIESLSKGFRQRVGLAQALLHDPKVLVLDEPTSGLDPNQLVEIRKLIREVSLNKTVIFSTHIMQEVQALCERVVVINKGKIVADDTLVNLMRSRVSDNSWVIEFEGPVQMAILKGIPSVDEVLELKPGVFKVTSATNAQLRSEIFRFAADNNLSLRGLRQEETSLESVFQELTR